MSDKPEIDSTFVYIEVGNSERLLHMAYEKLMKIDFNAYPEIHDALFDIFTLVHQSEVNLYTVRKHLDEVDGGDMTGDMKKFIQEFSDSRLKDEKEKEPSEEDKSK